MALQIPNLDKYGLSRTLGFLSDETPLTSFANAYFSKWDDLIYQLPELTKTHSIADRVRDLPLLDASKLTAEVEFRRAYVVLSFLIHGYIQAGSTEGKPLNVIPPQLAEPYLMVCEHLGLRPVLSYAGLCLWNWHVSDNVSAAQNDGGFFELEQLGAIGSFTGDRGEDAFYLVPVLVEADGGCLLPLLLEAVAAALSADTDFVIKSLQKSAEVFVRMASHLPKMNGPLDAEFFYHTLRPFFGAGTALKEQGYSRGVVFQFSDGSEQEAMCIAGTAGQSSFFQFLDLVLGVEHEKPKEAKETFFQEMRAYMPKKHREFLSLVSKLPPLRSFVEENNSNDELVTAFDNCLKQLRLWRGKHIAVVSKYIVRPARAASAQVANGVTTNGETKPKMDDIGEENGDDLRGTGGTSLIPFLRQTRDETVGSRSS